MCRLSRYANVQIIKAEGPVFTLDLLLFQNNQTLSNNPGLFFICISAHLLNLHIVLLCAYIIKAFQWPSSAYY
jgi:hypothetical protein